MASSDIVRAQSDFDELRLGRSEQTIVGRLLRFWDSKNIKKHGEFMSITMLLLDDKVHSDAGNDQPRALEQLRGRVYVFHVLVADKFMSRTCPFTVCGISGFVGLEVIVELARKCDATQLDHHSVNVSDNNP